MCDGWVILAAADSQVYNVCRELTLRVRFTGRRCEQPNLGIGNHAALLASKRFAIPPPPPPPVAVPDVRDLSPSAASAGLRAAGLVPRIAGTGTWVATQSPSAGIAVPRGSTVTCTTRRGPRL